MQRAVTCPFLAFRECRLPARKRSCSSGNASRQLWPHIWTQPCLSKRRHMSFLSILRVLFASPETLPQPRKRFLAALATGHTALPCSARHMSAFLTVSRVPFASLGTLPQPRKRFLAALATFLDTALPCKALWPHFWTQPCLAKGRHMSFLSVSKSAVCQPGNAPAAPETLLGSFGQISGHSLALQSAVTCPFLAFRDCRFYLSIYLSIHLSIYLSLYLSMSLLQIGGVGGTRALAHSILDQHVSRLG